MFEETNRLAQMQGLDGWPEADWPFEGGSYGKDLPNPIKPLHSATRLIWANVNVLWIDLADKHRWDAMVLMKRMGDTSEDPWRLMWLKDAFGSPALAPAMGRDTWGSGNTLDWGGKASLTYAKDLNDLKKVWAYSIFPVSKSFTCCPPDSDAGMSFRFDPDLGPAIEISDVDQLDEGVMIRGLTREELDQARVIRTDHDAVWVDVGGTLGVADPKIWAHWMQKKISATKPAHS